MQQNDGFVFVLQNFSGQKQAKDKKSFVSVVALALSDYISRTEISSDCVCKLRNGLHAEGSCEAKETKFLPPSVSGRDGVGICENLAIMRFFFNCRRNLAAPRDKL